MNIQQKALLVSLGSTIISIKPNTALSTIGISDVIGTGLAFNEVANKVTALVEKEIMMYKNVMVPTINTITHTVTEAVKARKLELLVATPDVAMLETPAFIDSLVTSRQLNNVNVSGYISDDGIRIPLVSDIYEYLQLEGSEANNMLRKFLRSYSKVELEAIWEKYISEMNRGNQNISTLLNTRGVTSKTVNDIFIVYVILVNLSIKTPKTALGTLDGFRNTVSIFKLLVSKAIHDRINLTNIKANSGILVLVNKERNRSIVVFKDSLDRFYEKGGTIDAIYGLAISGRSDLNKIDDVIRLNLELEKEWIAVFNASSAKVKANSVSVYKAIYFSVLTKVIDEHNFKFNPLNNKETEAKFRTMINGLSYVELHDVYLVIEKIFLEILFVNTNAKEFFSYVRYYSKDADLETGVTLATMELVSDYLTNQIEVSS